MNNKIHFLVSNSADNLLEEDFGGNGDIVSVDIEQLSGKAADKNRQNGVSRQHNSTAGSLDDFLAQ
jgi:hypothetical protein